jgi:hypothetical protein
MYITRRKADGAIYYAEDYYSKAIGIVCKFKRHYTLSRWQVALLRAIAAGARSATEVRRMNGWKNLTNSESAALSRALKRLRQRGLVGDGYVLTPEGEQVVRLLGVPIKDVGDNGHAETNG